MKLVRSCVPLLALAAALTPLTSARAQQSAEAQAPTDPRLAGLDAYIEKAMKDWEVPGLALAIVKNDSVIYARGYGVRELGKPDPVTPRTIFAVGSTSKAFTAALMAMLVDSGKVKWDDHVTQFLPWFQLYDPYVTREMTIHDILSHRSGLGRGDLLWYASPLSRDSVVKAVRNLKPSWSFRSHFGYQNIMFVTAGQVEAAVAGENWDRLVRHRIFEPLGMSASVTSVHDLQRGGDVATPHEKVDDKVIPIAWRDIDNAGPAGSIDSNVLDYARWLRFQLDDGVLPNGKRLISHAAMREMHSPQTIIPITEEAEKLNPWSHFSAYGLGWFLLDYRGNEIIHHGGNIDGFSAEVDLVPEQKLGIVIFTNLNGTALRDALPYAIYDRFLGVKDGKDWSAAYLEQRKKMLARADSMKAKVEAAHVKGTKPSLTLDKYAGVYADSLYGPLTISLEKDHLVATRSAAFVADLEHWDYDNFRAVWRDHTLGKQFFTFQVDPMGKAAAVTIEDLATFERVPERSKATAAGGAGEDR
ncbi:MAG TPA: serine hydrolase [Longimicrobiales bacterium]